jgi:hypothetical protein
MDENNFGLGDALPDLRTVAGTGCGWWRGNLMSQREWVMSSPLDSGDSIEPTQPRPMHLIGGTHPFDREIERVAGYTCEGDSDGGECD